MRSSRPVAVAAALLLLVSTLAGCSFPQLGEGGMRETTPTGEPVDAELEPFYQQEVEWKSCGDGMQCADLRAPLDWSDPGADEISLAVVLARSTGDAKGSLFVNPGGPGGSGFDFIQNGVDYAVSAAVRRQYDVVGWDPRGVGRSTPVTCLDDEDKDELLYGTFDAAYGSEAWIDEVADEYDDFAEACVDNTGPLLGHIDTGSVARDLDLLRSVLGNDELTYLGYSYGTSIGSTYAELFPEKVGRMVLDGAVEPLLSDFEMLKVQMGGFESAVRAYMAACLDGSIGECPFSGSVDRGLAQLRALIDDVDGMRLQNPDGRILDSATLGTGLAYALYSQGSWPDITRMVQGVAAGDPEPVFENADGYNGRLTGGGYDSNSFEVYTAVTCLDGDFAADGASTIDRLAQIDVSSPTVGRAIALDDFAALDVVCSEWPEPRPDLPTEFDAEGAPPILVIGTTNDPATPYAWAQSLADQLSSGVLISYEGEGHTIYNQGVTCVDDAVDAYFLDGTVPAADPMC